MVRKKWLAVLVLAVLVPVGALAWHLSSWNIWEQLPASDTLRLVINPAADKSEGRATALTTFMSLPDTATRYLPETRRLGYSQTDTQRFLVLAPKLSTLFSLPKQLVQEGWHVRRSGLLLQAWSSTAPDGATTDKQGSVTRAFFVSLGKAVLGRYSERPWALGSVTTPLNPALPASFRFTAQTTTHELVVRLTQDAALPHLGPQAALPNPEAYISLPGEAFSHLPESTQRAWETVLQQKLHFTHTKPAILATLTAFSHATVAFDGTSAALSVTGDTATFQKQANEWLQQEDSHSRFVKKAFRLPDGTLGYEDVPADIQDVLQASATDPACLIPQGDRTSLVLCHDATHVALATSTDFAKQFLTTPRPQWEISVRGSFLNTLPVTDLTKLTLVGSSDDVVAHLWW